VKRALACQPNITRHGYSVYKKDIFIITTRKTLSKIIWSPNEARRCVGIELEGAVNCANTEKLLHDRHLNLCQTEVI
jgi:hypothetical protein